METMMLPVELTDDERNARGRELARLLELYDQAEIKEKSRAKAAKKELEEARQAVRALQQAVYEGVEERPVEVYTRYDYAASLVRKFRTDTHEMCSSRAMTEEEKQSNLFDDEVPTTKTTVGKTTVRMEAPEAEAPAKASKMEVVNLDLPPVLADEEAIAALDAEVEQIVEVTDSPGVSAWLSWWPAALNHDVKVHYDGAVSRFAPAQHADIIAEICEESPEGATVERLLHHGRTEARAILGLWRKHGALQLLADGRFRPVRPADPRLGDVAALAESAEILADMSRGGGIPRDERGKVLPLSIYGCCWTWATQHDLPGYRVFELLDLLDRPRSIGELAVRTVMDTTVVALGLSLLKERGLVTVSDGRWSKAACTEAPWVHKWPEEWGLGKRWKVGTTWLGTGHVWQVLEELDRAEPMALTVIDLQRATRLAFDLVDKALKVAAKAKLIRQRGDGWELDLVGRTQSDPPAADTKPKKKRGKTKAEQAVDDAMDGATD